MDKFELVYEVLDLCDNDFSHGIAELLIDSETLEELQRREAEIDSKREAPTVEEYECFLNKYENRNIELNIMVTDPARDDFRIEITGLKINAEYAKLRTQEDMLFWKDFMDLGSKGNACMLEDDESVYWNWTNK